MSLRGIYGLSGVCLMLLTHLMPRECVYMDSYEFMQAFRQQLVAPLDPTCLLWGGGLRPEMLQQFFLLVLHMADERMSSPQPY